MIHGYGATGLIFYKFIGHLKKFFRVITIDFLGMRASGRPSFTLNTGKVATGYLVIS